MAALLSKFTYAMLAPLSEGCYFCFPFCWTPTKMLNEYSSRKNLQLCAQKWSGGFKASYKCLLGVLKALIVESSCSSSNKKLFNTLGNKKCHGRPAVLDASLLMFKSIVYIFIKSSPKNKAEPVLSKGKRLLAKLENVTYLLWPPWCLLCIFLHSLWYIDLVLCQGVG